MNKGNLQKIDNIWNVRFTDTHSFGLGYIYTNIKIIDEQQILNNFNENDEVYFTTNYKDNFNAKILSLFEVETRKSNSDLNDKLYKKYRLFNDNPTDETFNNLVNEMKNYKENYIEI